MPGADDVALPAHGPKEVTRHAPRVWDGLRAVKRAVLRKKVREGYTGSLGHGTAVVSG